MNKEQLLIEIISLPAKFHSLENISIYSFLQDVEYLKFKDMISEKDIAAALLQHPKYTDGWILWSADKRSGGWYLTSKDHIYTVGYYPEKLDFPAVKYIDKIDACASFIKREIDSVVSG